MPRRIVRNGKMPTWEEPPKTPFGPVFQPEPPLLPSSYTLSAMTTAMVEKARMRAGGTLAGKNRGKIKIPSPLEGRGNYQPHRTKHTHTHTHSKKCLHGHRPNTQARRKHKKQNTHNASVTWLLTK